MSDTGMTTMNVKKINKNKVYNFIYKEKTTSKQQIVTQLQMGLSTVSQNLKDLEDEGLIEKNGFFESTGGRKAQAIQIARTCRMAIGVGILKDKIHITAVDLYGTAVCQTTITYMYTSEPSYYEQLGQYVTDFIEDSGIPASAVLGVSISTQGILAPDGHSVSYGVIMDNSHMKLSDFEQYIPYPCRLEHDSKAAAYLELWNHRELNNAVVLLLNPNLGGAVIANKTVHQGNHMRSGIIEHLCINQDGPMCYCGKRGCLETYCSANYLEHASGMSIPEFFDALARKPAPALSQLWTDYLNHLAFAIRNLNIIFDGDIIISGYLAPYFREQDVAFLLEQINTSTPFPLSREQILLGTHGQYTPAIGGALTFIEEFTGGV